VLDVDVPFDALRDHLEVHGKVPLPPYIRRAPEPEDAVRYQTVYAANDGSVAAPTAGLHFTDALLDEIRARGVETAFVTLHVGPGTFRPVVVEDIGDHVMESESYVLTADVVDQIDRAKTEGRPVMAVGTTVTRALEGAFQAEGELLPGGRETDLFIKPGFEFKVIDGLMTNFHLPRSTLLCLVSALAGRERILGAYEEAVARQYRFYSYGDAMLIMPQKR
jgi:S-adenosylmethionine:tRNA ribosyltransferase-isomerase